ncbi:MULTISPECIES: carboxymuconolactone decarboxylase family protein [Flavobacterium]|uniref:Carboxymuconolactone decarboxylase family protein n=1 Tax=Flavobacterium jumunjinense TaxID=998845 RepID=A0ABV5GM81_9FLAO|nr:MULTISPECIES: carboxymuconolactone decarboxylase family protein [Flavobacterium]
MERITFERIPKGMVESLMKTESYIKETSLEFGLLELIRLRVSQINKCAYCIDMHYKELKQSGETELRLSTLSVWQETPFFTEKEKATLLFAESLTIINQSEITDSMYKSLTSFYDDETICNLILIVAQINSWNRIVRTLKFIPGNYIVQ